MSAIAELKRIASDIYTDDNGEQFVPVLFPGLSDPEIDHFKTQLSLALPEEIERLLRMSSGLTFSGLEDITFQGKKRKISVTSFQNI